MYTGMQKKAIVLKNCEGCLFEEAYFILKDDCRQIKESEMVVEANRILKNNIIGGYFAPQNDDVSTKESKKKSVFYFLLGALISFVLCGVIFLVFK